MSVTPGQPGPGGAVGRPDDAISHHPGDSPPAGPPYGSAPLRPPARASGILGIEPSPPPPRGFRGLLAFLVVEVVFLGASFVVSRSIGVSTATDVLIAIAVPTILAALTCVVWSTVVGNGPSTDLGLRFRWADVGLGLLVGVAGFFVTIPVALLYLWLVDPHLTSSVGEVFHGIRAPWPIALAVMVGVVVIAPICEEIVYRGLLWNALAYWIPHRWIVFVLTTAVFALAHLELLRAPVLFVVALPIGFARLVTGRVTAGIVAHAINNFLPGLALALMLVGALPTL